MDQTVLLITAAARAAALWTGLNLLTLLALAFLVVRARQTHKVMLGDQNVPELTRAVRVHGNATEYVPALLASLAVLVAVGASQYVIHAVGALTFFGRVLHAFGLSRNSGVTRGRLIGTVLTWLAFIVAGLALLYYAAI